MATAINAALALHFLTYHARIAASNAMGLYFGGFFAGAMAGVLVWVRVSRLFEKHLVYAATTIVTAVVISGGYWLLGEGRPFGTGNVPVLVTLTGLAGFFGIAAAVVAPSMMADITAQDELQSGRRRDGIFFGVYSFGQQLSSGLAVLVAGVLVDRFAAMVPGQADQSAETIERLAMISNLLPAVILAGAAVIALQYDLTHRRMESIEQELTGSSGQLDLLGSRQQ
jgi:Na+/melibiose symporter-like transporter